MAKLLLNARVEARTYRGLKMQSLKTNEPISKIVREILEANVPPITKKEIEIEAEDE